MGSLDMWWSRETEGIARVGREGGREGGWRKGWIEGRREGRGKKGGGKAVGRVGGKREGGRERADGDRRSPWDQQKEPHKQKNNQW